MFTPTRNVLIACAAMLLAAPWSAAAADSGILAKSNFSATATGTTDYVFRGISQTNESLAFQGSFDYAHPVGVYLGAWASNVHSSVASGGLEVDYYLGYSREIGSFGFDLGGLYYHYPKSGSSPEPDYIEVYLGLSYALPVALEPTLGAQYNYSPDFFGEDGDGHYINASLNLSLPMEFGLSGEVGYQDVEGDKTTPDGFDYVHYRIGISKAVLGFDLDLSFHNTAEDDELPGDIVGERLVFSMSRTL